MRNLEDKKLGLIKGMQRINLIKSEFDNFLNEIFKENKDKITYCVVYNQEKDRNEIKQRYGEFFTEAGPLPENNEKAYSLISEFSKKYNVPIDYFIKIDIISNMNYKK